ncbi:Rqc2 family fibronectin-binding protein [Anaerococcus nagyae]|uniref:Rqc2 family fibronectin-binding protein n=1 Tax=Anaerococcus nagyae TaxID=1755241 RepID=UPI001AE35D94|nr:NFACT RNA binding domain-containing protein [Anaerococcus nagyae]MBP2069756.1 putative ribosome quality control (RQC) complex YloA/Tae2 family protein [Anaerococcus nagyae]
MSYDGIVTRKVVNEIREKLLGGKIQKITQPSKNDIVLNVYSMGKSYKLLLSANNNEARINLTQKKYENPDIPPNFTMVLRKHINQAKIIDIIQKDLDRVVIFSISSIDEMGFDTSKKLIVEIMGKYSNIILVDDNYKVIDSIKRVNENMSSIRQILPGVKYEFVDNDKYDITDESFDYDIKKLDQKLSDSTRPDKIFHKTYTGFSPIVGKELIYRAGIDSRINWGLVSESEKDRLNNLLYELRDEIINGNLKSFTYSDDKKIKEFHTIKLSHLDFKEKSYSTMSESIEEFYNINKSHDRLNQIKTSLIKKINSHIKNTNKKLNILSNNILQESKIEGLRKNGDLLSANVHKISKGDNKIVLDDFYDNNKKIEIKLDPTKTPWENTENYYTKAKKIKNSVDYAKKDIPRQNDYLEYLNQLCDFINRSQSIEDLNDIRDEMIENNLIKKSHKHKIKNKKSKPYHYKTKNGSDIYVGKNSKQNDYITLKLANKDDLWFHVKDVPGSHVILRSDNINDEDINIASYLAAVNSSISSDNKINIDYTEKKNVNKAKGAKPGMVYYENFSTITIDTNLKVSDKYKEI